jgi:16S rRNA processing protein RimM
VTVVLTSDRLERVAPGAELYADDRRLVVATSRPHRGRWLIGFEGVDDRGAAEQLRGGVLTGEPLGRPDDDHRIWVGDVIGAEVRDRTGRLVGNVAAIEANPAHDLLVLDDGALVPAVFVVDHADGLVVVDLPAGLLDVNRRDD